MSARVQVMRRNVGESVQRHGDAPGFHDDIGRCTKSRDDKEEIASAWR